MTDWAAEYPLSAAQLQDLGVAYVNCSPSNVGRLLLSYQQQMKDIRAELG